MRDKKDLLFSGDLHKLDALSRTNLAKLMDPVKPNKDWMTLAERLAMGSLVQPLKMHTSPTKALLDNFEASLILSRARPGSSVFVGMPLQ